MKKKILAVLLASTMLISTAASVWAAPLSTTSVSEETALDTAAIDAAADGASDSLSGGDRSDTDGAASDTSDGSTSASGSGSGEADGSSDSSSSTSSGTSGGSSESSTNADADTNTASADSAENTTGAAASASTENITDIADTASAETDSEITDESSTSADSEEEFLTGIYSFDDAADNDELFEEYVEKQFQNSTSVRKLRRNSIRFNTSSSSTLYSLLSSRISAVAQTGGSTIFQLTSADLGDPLIYESKDAAKEEVLYVLYLLALNMPYELYWFNKTYDSTTETGGARYGVGVVDVDEGVQLTSVTMKMSVAESYQDSSASGTADSQYVLTSDVSKVSTAVANANAVVAANADKTDIEKLTAYKNYICDAVSYNKEAAASGDYSGLIDAWQMIYVFDEDADTNVVCEGYAKAFQYLCDQSTFRDSETGSYLVQGKLSNHLVGATGTGNGHMWNIVTMGEQNYLVDVTNSDTGMVGADGIVFLKNNVTDDSSSDTVKIIYKNNQYCLEYTYDSVTRQTVSSDILDLSARRHQLTFVAGQAATCAATGLASYYQCSICGELFSDETGTVSVTKADLVLARTTTHSWGSWVVTKAATPTTTGTQKRTCTVCGKTETQSIAKTGSLSVKDGSASVNYQTHVQNVGWQSYVSNGAMSGTTGRSLRLEGIRISLSNQEYSGGIQYSTHVQNIGWQGWVSDGAMSGTSGRSLRLEAIKIRLTGEMANQYDVYYQVHAQNYGWLDWAKNGEAAGTAGYSYRLEGIRIVLVDKGDNAPGSTATPYKHPLVSYQTHVQNVGWQSSVTDGAVSGTSGRSLRLEGIKISLSNQEYTGGIQYSTHVQNIGWQSWASNGSLSGTSGRSLRLEAIKIRLTGEMANQYDVYYRVHAQNYGWLGWARNGTSAGTAGKSLRLEAIQIVLVKKGASAPGSTANAFIS